MNEKRIVIPLTHECWCAGGVMTMRSIGIPRHPEEGTVDSGTRSQWLAVYLASRARLRSGHVPLEAFRELRASIYEGLKEGEN